MQPRLGLALLWLAGTLGAAGAAPHHYTRAERYAGCLFGETIPLMRRGLERERALETASARCAAWADGLMAGEIRAVEADARRAVERFERQGP